ncbi:PREDICTED: exosome complex component CSL4 [Papilio xuthus]|uniref:Exosome complex component CSL4 n=1 Tax=Papilio xuthus TaxID=66420 RepID=A0A0N1PH92_PAPXU|nr:PREDICTED: exosome complex component CSL4 [Papilio xuthus]KPJ03823.1 Exosome complex component CSL4 [Papilio xuthus]
MEQNKSKPIGKICIPGMRLCSANKERIGGPGTNVLQGYIYAALAGVLKTQEDEKNKVTVISVESPTTPSILPKPGDVVTAKVTVVNSRVVHCIILCVGPHLVRPYRGVLKKEDIKSTDKDRIDPYKCFRPGDVILAKVLPLTEIHWYHLTTAENELGVAIATAEGSPQGVNMVPISWSEMQCPKTLVKEPRKVARIVPDYFDQNQVISYTDAENESKPINDPK